MSLHVLHTDGVAGLLVPVIAAVNVPGPVALLLVLGTALGVWLGMTWRRVQASRRRLLRQTSELAAENERLTGELAAQCSGTLEEILGASAQMNAMRHPPELMNRIVSLAAEITGFQKVALYVWSDVAQAMETPAFVGWARDEIVALGAPYEREIDLNRVGQWRLQLGNCYLVDMTADLPGQGHLAAPDWLPGQLLIAPLATLGGTPLGYLSLADPADGLVPGTTAVRQLEFLVQQATTALESVEVYQKLARNNAELMSASAQLNSLADMKRNFISNVSHELRTPLTSISAYSELLQNNMDTLSGDSLGEFIKVIHAESVKLAGVVNDVLELNEADKGRPTLVHAEANVAALVRRLDDSWRERALKRGIDFAVETDADEVVMPVDSTLIQQLLAHLVGNAFKFTPDGGRIRVGLRETGTAVRLTVSDSGIGIPVAKLGEIFDRFFQVDGSPTREHNGQGVGLALCHDIVTNHDGRIWAENIETGGARLTVLLPRRPVVLQPATKTAPTGQPFAAGEFTERLLLWVSESLGVQVATLLMPEAAGAYLSIRAAIGLPAAVVQSAQIRAGEGFAGQVWASGETLLIDDVTQGARETSEPRYSTPSLLCVPLRHGDAVTGVLTVNNRIDGRPLGPDDRLCLESMAPYIAAMLSRYTAWQDDGCRFGQIRETLRATTAVGHLRHETIVHVSHEICLATARAIDLPDDELRHLAFALQFYDVGLGCVPPQLLGKPGPFTAEEERRVQDHVTAGLEILEPLQLAPRVRLIISHHHENFDGSGYPMGLAGEAIPRAARLVRLTDTFSALLGERPWRPAYSLDEAMAEIRQGTGREYCPRIADLFLAEVESHRGRLLALQAAEDDGRELLRPALDGRGMKRVSV